MSKYLEKLKSDNPVINKILCKQEESKWEITQGERYRTVNNIATPEVLFNDSFNLKSDIICPHGVKY